MKGISVATTTMALIIVSLSLLAVIVPFFWSSLVDVIDALGATIFQHTVFLSSDVYIITPPALNPSGSEQYIFVFNLGEETLTETKVLAIQPDLNVLELNLTVVRNNGLKESVGTVLNEFYPGDLIIGRIPGETSYEGWRFVFQSREYTEAKGVG